VQILASPHKAAASSGVAGYFGGGRVTGGGLTGVDKITFATGVKSVSSATLTVAIYQMGSCANSGVAGYFGGGFAFAASTQTKAIQKVAFPSDTKSVLSGITLTDDVYDLASMANSGVAGYFGGGGDINFAEIDRIDKLTFSTEIRSTLGIVLSSPLFTLSAMANSGVAGYFCGGADNPVGQYSRIDKVTFPGDTKSTLFATLTTARNQTSASANSGVAGYVFGGNDSGGRLTGIDKITFPGDTRTTMGTVLSAAKGGTASMADTGNASFIGGGSTGTRTNVIEKFSHVTELMESYTDTLTTAADVVGAFADCGVF